VGMNDNSNINKR